MRFDEFVAEHNIEMATVDQFDGYVVEVAVPAGWEPFDSPSPGARVWVWSADPFRDQFCANVVLTMTRVQAVLDPVEVFAMLCDWQVHLLPASRETYRDLAGANEGPGVGGVLALQITGESGVLDSVSLTRIVTAEPHTLIAQLTLTALQDSPVDRAGIRLLVTPGAWAGSGSTQYHGSAGGTATAESH